jgi:hypothetical protein
MCPERGDDLRVAAATRSPASYSQERANRARVAMSASSPGEITADVEASLVTEDSVQGG